MSDYYIYDIGRTAGKIEKTISIIGGYINTQILQVVLWKSSHGLAVKRSTMERPRFES